MKILGILSVVCILGLTLPAKGQNMLPSVRLKTLEGKDIDLIEFANNGKITIISVWATWCAPCKMELDAITEVYETWQRDYQVELVAITIDTQRQLAKVKPMVESKGWNFTILSDAHNMLRKRLGVSSIPQTFIVGRDGEIIYSHTGYSPGDEEKLKKQLDILTTE